MENKNMEITKEMIEKNLGYEINNFELEPIYDDGECIGLNVKVEPKITISTINTTINISKTCKNNNKIN